MRVVRYAAERGICVVPEIDMPGQCLGDCRGLPELMSAPGPYAMERHWGVLKPVLDPTKDATYALPTQWLANWRRSSPIRICISAVTRSMTASGKRTPRSRISCATKQAGGQPRAAGVFQPQAENDPRENHRQMVGWDEIYHPDCRKAF